MMPKIARMVATTITALASTAPTSLAQPLDKVAATKVSPTSANLYIHIEHEPLTDYDILCSVFDSEDSFLKSPTQSTRLGPLSGTPGSCQFKLQAGRQYAVSVVIDENRNGKLDTNLFGIPTEAIGTSNNPTSRFGPPSFEESSFLVENEEARIMIRASKVF